jgi:hypothetical protein
VVRIGKIKKSLYGMFGKEICVTRGDLMLSTVVFTISGIIKFNAASGVS